MALAVTTPQLFSVAIQVVDPDAPLYNIHTVWIARKLSDSSLVEIPVDAPWTSDVPLVQSDWDTIFGDAATGFVAAAGGTAPTVNPVVI